MNGNELINKLSNLTLPETTLIEAIGNSGKLFVGQVNLTELSIRPKKTFSQNSMIYYTKLTASLESTKTSVTIKGEIQLTKFYPLIMLSILSVFFIISFIIIVQENATAGIMALFQATLMLGVFYLIFSRAIKKSKIFFEKELYFLTNNSH